MLAVITGAGRGLGRATALELAEHGWDLALLARSRGQLDAVAAEARGRGVGAEVFPVAVEDVAAVRAVFEELDRRCPQPDALVNCAGTGTFAPVSELDPAEWSRIVSVNLTGTFLCCQEASRRMVARGGGSIVNVLSIASRMALPGAAAYCASKWGALGFTKVLAEEVRRHGVRVTALCPGSIATPFWNEIPHSFDLADMLQPGEVAAAIRFLLEQPPGVYTDELVLTPPKGLL